MQSSGGSRSAARVRYSYRPPSDESEEAIDGRAESDAGDDSEYEAPAAQAAPAAAAAAPSASLAAPASGSSGSTKASSSSSTLSRVLDSVRDNPTLLAGAAAGLAATGGLAFLLSALSRRNSSSNHNSSAAKGKAAAAGPGPNSKVKATASCAPLADGSAVVVHRPIAADNSCLFNAVGYCMHHSTNRAPFLRQVVSREVSSDPQEYSAAFLGMENAAYCAWITNPAHWGGGIELAILASHYRREIAAWNLATGACHVFGEDSGYTKRVMVIYNGVHYDALAISPGPRAVHEEDSTEFNPRTRRGKMIIAAAQKLVQLKRQGKEGHHEQQDKQKQQERQQRKQNKQQRQQTPSPQPAEQQQQADGSNAVSSKEQPEANGHSPAAAAAPLGAVGSSDGSNGNSSSRVEADADTLLGCQSCGVTLQGVDAARAHAAATGHVEFAEVQ